MKKSLLSVIAFAFVSANSFGQLLFENRTTRPVWVAITYYQQSSAFKGWFSEGWWKVEPGETSQVLPGPLKQQYYYYTAHNDVGRVWGEGDTKILVHPTDVFKIKNANMDYVKAENSSFEWRNFKQVDVGTSKRLTLLFTDQNLKLSNMPRDSASVGKR